MFFHCVNMATFEETGSVFWKWLQDNGATLSKDIAIKDYRSEEAGRGVIATNDIKVWTSTGLFYRHLTSANFTRKGICYSRCQDLFCYRHLPAL